MPAADGRQTRAGAEVGEDHAPASGGGPGEPLEFLQGEGERQPVEAVAVQPCRAEAPGDRQKAGRGREVFVEGGVEARDLEDTRQALGEGFDQPDFGRQMRRSELNRRAQVRQQLGGNDLRLPTICGSLWSGPPWTMRCPTAVMLCSRVHP